MKNTAILNSILVVLFLAAFAMPTYAQTEGENTEIEIENEVEEAIEEIEEAIEEIEEEIEIETKERRIRIIIGDDDEEDSNGNDEECEEDDRPRSGIITRSGMLDLGVSSYLFDNQFNLPSELGHLEQEYLGSTNVNLHFLRYRLPLIKGHVYIENGLSAAWNQYKFASNFDITPEVDEHTITALEGDYRKNKLKTTSIEMPLLLTIVPGNKQSQYLSVGAYGGFLLTAKQKLVDASGDKTIIKDDFNLNKVYYGVEGRIGLGPVSFYAKYSLKNLFQDGEGPELTPVSVGITLVNF